MVFGRTTLGGLVASALLVANSWAAPDVSQPEKRQSSPFAITGVTGTGNQPRLELRTLQENTDLFNIYILGLSRMQTTDQSDYLSWFQLAGIHGLPMQDWNGVAGNPNTNPPAGYCTHVSNMFLPWHRPYLALYEQVLQANAMDAANEFTGDDQAKYVAAAQNVRSPYWDWAMVPANGGNAIPDIMTQPGVTVTTPSGQQTIQNPLYSYKFQTEESAFEYSPFTTWMETYRNPVSTDNPSSSNNDQLISAMNGQQASLASRLYNLFTNYNTFSNVSNEAYYQGMSGNFDSIESIHDVIHSLVGGQNSGDMSVIEISAYDPAFWLHHTMVDRFFALWQTLYPDTYVEPASQIYGNYWYTAGTELDSESPLFPFHADTAGNFWTPDSVRDYSQFGYTYPELQSGNNDDIKAAVNQLYGAGQSTSSKTKRGSYSVEDLVSAVEDVATSLPSDAAALVDDIGSYLGVSSDIDYLVTLRTDKNGADGSYQIYIFIGNVPSDVSDYMTCDSLVGIQGITAMMNTAAAPAALVSGSIPLTHFLEKHVVLKLLSGLDTDLVLPYLKANLSWKVIGNNGQEISASDLPDLLIGVESTAIQKTSSLTEFPQWVGGFTSHLDVTSGKPNGLCESD